jgi:hypothetical protein
VEGDEMMAHEKLMPWDEDPLFWTQLESTIAERNVFKTLLETAESRLSIAEKALGEIEEISPDPDFYVELMGANIGVVSCSKIERIITAWKEAGR